MIVSNRSDRKWADPLFGTIIGTTLVLGTLCGVLIIFWGAGPVLFETPWYIPTMHSFAGLAAFSVAFLALGRYHVLRDPAAYWIGTAFAAFGILSIFFILTWPGLLPSGQGLIAQLPSTSGWIALLELSSLNLFLLAALLGVWPRVRSLIGRRWLWSVGAWLLVITWLASLIVVFEQSLPLLVDSQGNLTPLLLRWDWVFMLLFAVGAVLSTRRYLDSGDKLLGYVAFTQIALAFVVLTALIGARRYDLWYYLSRLLLVGGFLAMMFGLLAEYVGLFRRERDKTREIQVRSAELLGILQNSPDAVFVTDEQGGLRYASKNALDLLRVNGVADLSRPVADWTAAYEVSERTGRRLSDEELPLARVARGETIQGEEVQFRDLKNGGAIWLLVSGGPLTDETGQRIGGLLVGTDITEHIRAEEALRLSEERFAKAFWISPDVIIISRQADGQILEVNEQWEALFGYSREAVIGRTSLELNLFANPTDRQRIIHQLHQAGAVRDFELEIRHKSGKLRQASLSVDAIVIHNEPCLLTILRDITERKRAEEVQTKLEAQLRQAQKMESVGRLAGGVAHDFNNLLTVINGYCLLIQNNLSPDDPLFEPLEQVRRANVPQPSPDNCSPSVARRY